jgi:signal transduction histidine kinase
VDQLEEEPKQDGQDSQDKEKQSNIHAVMLSVFILSILSILLIVPNTLVLNYAPSVQDFQLLHTSRNARSRA